MTSDSSYPGNQQNPGQNQNPGGWQNQPPQGDWQNQQPGGWGQPQQGQGNPQQWGAPGQQYDQGQQHGQPQQHGQQNSGQWGAPQQNAGQQQGFGEQQNFAQQNFGQQPPQGGGFPRLAIRQKITLTVNRYEVYVLDEQGNEGQFLAVAQQKRMALKELVTFYADDQRTQELFSFRARKRLDYAATYDVVDAHGNPIGHFRKDFGKSFTRSTWHLAEPGGAEMMGQERSAALAIIRRILGDNLPFLNSMYHFDFVTGSGEPVMQHSRIMSMRNRYAVELPSFQGRRLDWRLAAAMGVALDALQAR